MGAGEHSWLLRAVAVALALSAGFLTWLATDDGEPAVTAAPGPRVVAADDLADLATVSGIPVYWAGPIPGTELELTEGPGRNVQVRYLKDGAAAGERKADFLTVGTYPLADPEAALDNLAAQPGSSVRVSRTGRRIVVDRRAPNSAYFASPDNRVQVEIYDRVSGRALRLALSDRVRPVG